MAKTVLKNVSIDVDGTEFKDHISSITVETTDDEVDGTNFGSVNKETLKGLGDATITVHFQQDFDAGSVDAVLWPLKQSEDPFPIVVKPKDAAVSATNPAYQLAESLLFGYSPLAGAVGELSGTDVAFRNAGSAGLERLTA